MQDSIIIKVHCKWQRMWEDHYIYTRFHYGSSVLRCPIELQNHCCYHISHSPTLPCSHQAWEMVLINTETPEQSLMASKHASGVTLSYPVWQFLRNASPDAIKPHGVRLEPEGRGGEGRRGGGDDSLDNGINDSSVVCSLHLSTPTSWLMGKDRPSCFMAIVLCWLNWGLSTFGWVYRRRKQKRRNQIQLMMENSFGRITWRDWLREYSS